MRIERMCILMLSLVLAWGLCPSAGHTAPPVPTATDEETILDIGSHWRYHVVLSPPMVSLARAKTAGMGTEVEDRTIRRIADNGRDETSPLLGVRIPPPPQDWNLPGFDDLGWASLRRPLRGDPLDTAWPKELSPEYGVVYGRFKFMVNDPEAVKKLMTRAGFRGGLAAYLNGQEVARASLPAGKLDLQAPGDDYPDEATLLNNKTLLHWYNHRDKVERFKMRDRTLEWTAIDPKLLRKGVNVLAVEIHRSDYPALCKRLGPRWGAERADRAGAKGTGGPRCHRGGHRPAAGRAGVERGRGPARVRPGFRRSGGTVASGANRGRAQRLFFRGRGSRFHGADRGIKGTNGRVEVRRR